MDKRFLEIKKAYSDYYRSLLAKGRLNCRDTEIGFWGCSSMDAVYAFFKDIQLDKYPRFIDLGSGDGVVAAIASLFTDVTGVEFDKELHLFAQTMKQTLNLDVHFISQDFFDIDLSAYDIIYINPDTSFSRGLEKKMLKELSGSLVVYNNIFSPDFLEKGKTIWYDQVPFTFFTNPRP